MFASDAQASQPVVALVLTVTSQPVVEPTEEVLRFAVKLSRLGLLCGQERAKLKDGGTVALTTTWSSETVRKATVVESVAPPVSVITG